MLRRHALDLNQLRMVLRIGLEISPKATLALLSASFSRSTDAIGIGVDGVVDLHLKNQVGSALQIESEVNALCSAASKPWPVKLLGTPKIPNTNTISTATMRMVLARRFFFMMKTATLLRLGIPPWSSK